MNFHSIRDKKLLLASHKYSKNSSNNKYPQKNNNFINSNNNKCLNSSLQVLRGQFLYNSFKIKSSNTNHSCQLRNKCNKIQFRMNKSLYPMMISSSSSQCMNSKKLINYSKNNKYKSSSKRNFSNSSNNNSNNSSS